MQEVSPSLHWGPWGETNSFSETCGESWSLVWNQLFYLKFSQKIKDLLLYIYMYNKQGHELQGKWTFPQQTKNKTQAIRSLALFI